MSLRKVEISSCARGPQQPPEHLRVALFGQQAQVLAACFAPYPNLEVVEDAPDLIVCYGGDGTLLAAELLWPNLPKVPVLNSRRGHRCIPHPPDQVIAGLAKGTLLENTYLKIECALHHHQNGGRDRLLVALNEFNVHMGRINSAVRFQLWFNDIPYAGAEEILGDGFLISTPFGSTAYFAQITRGVFNTGLGIAFKSTTQHISHVVLPEDTVVRALITRGPAILGFDSSTDYYDLDAGDEMIIRRHAVGAKIWTCEPVLRLDEPF